MDMPGGGCVVTLAFESAAGSGRLRKKRNTSKACAHEAVGIGPKARRLARAYRRIGPFYRGGRQRPADRSPSSATYQVPAPKVAWRKARGRCEPRLGQKGHAAHHCVRPHRRSPTHAGRLVHQPRESKRQPQQAALGLVTKNGRRRDSLSLDTERHSVLMTCVTCVSRVRSGRGAVAACHRPCATLPPCAKHTPHRPDSRRSAPARNACCSPGWLTTFSM